MDINSPQAVSFCNAPLRTTADKAGQFYHTAKRVLEEFGALNLGDVIPNTSDVVQDGAVSDGRPILTGALVNAFMSGLTQYVSTLEANDNQLLKIVLQIAPNPA